MSSAVEPRQKSLQNPITTETRDSSNVNSSASSLQNQKIDKKALDTSSQKQEQKYKRAPSGTSKSDATGDGRELISSTSSTLANSQASNRTKNGNTASSGSPSAQESPHPPNPNPADGIGSSSSSGGTPQTEGQRTSSKQKLAPHALSQGSKSQQAPFTSIGETQSQQKDFAYMTIKPHDEHVAKWEIEEGTMNERELLYFEAKNYKGPVVIFLPRVIELLKTPKFRDDLAKKFHINDFFLTKTAYDSNGFFRHYNEPNVASACRFLIKELSQIPESSKFRDEKKTIQKVLLPELLESAGADAVDIVSVPEVSNESLLGEFLKKWQEWKKEHYNSLSQNSEEDKANSESFRILSEEDDRQNIQAAIEDLDRILKGFENNDFFQHLHAVIDEWDNLPDGAATFRWLSKSVRKDLYKLFMEALANSIHQPVCIMGRSQKSQVKESLPQNEELSGGNNGSQQSEQKTPGVPQESEQKGHGAQQQSKRKAQRQNNSRMVGWWNGKQSQRKDSEDKEDKKDKLMHTYHWFFLFFWTVFLHHNNEDPPPESHGIPPQGGNGPLDPEGTQIFLCFDDASGPKMKEIIKKILEMRCGLAPLGHNSVLLPQVVEEVLHVYDTALWGFRSPVRDIEKRRQEHIGKIKKDFNIYFDMHELSRHLIHSEETLAAAETTLNAILQSDWPLNTSKNSTIQFSLTFIKNLNLRAKAFIERLENEIRLAYHINNVRQLVQVDELLRESRNDGKDVAKFVGYASIVFLPGTFVSGFFSMTFFGFVPESSTWGRTGHWWIWFAITIPITLIGVFLFAWRHSEEKLSQFLILVLTLRIFYRVNRQEKK